jgi:transcriptional regulator with XRE-family HTH domain
MESQKTYKIIGENIEIIRVKTGKSVAEFAKYISVSESQLKSVLRGIRGFSITKLINISEITNVPISFILTGSKISESEEILQKLSEAEEHMEKAKNIIRGAKILME